MLFQNVSGAPECHIVHHNFSKVELYSIVKHCHPISKAHTHDIQASHTTVMMTCYIWLYFSNQLERIKVLPWMLSRDLTSQASPFCPEEESQMGNIRSPLTPQGEEVRITARMGGPQHWSSLTHNPKPIIWTIRVQLPLGGGSLPELGQKLLCSSAHVSLVYECMHQAPEKEVTQLKRVDAEQKRAPTLKSF